jgi:hypothetical protein
MKRIKVRLEGVTPLICNKFSDEKMLAATAGTRSNYKGKNGTPLEDAESKLYTGDNGELIIPNVNIFTSIADAGKFHKMGRKQVTTQKSSLLYAFASIEEIKIPIDHKQPWKVDTRPVCIPPGSGQRVLINRPMFDDWALEFTLAIDEQMVNEKFMREIVDTAGKCIGLGDYRPDRKGPYGKFVVTHWKEE